MFQRYFNIFVPLAKKIPHSVPPFPGNLSTDSRRRYLPHPIGSADSPVRSLSSFRYRKKHVPDTQKYTQNTEKNTFFFSSAELLTLPRPTRVPHVAVSLCRYVAAILNSTFEPV